MSCSSRSPICHSSKYLLAISDSKAVKLKQVQDEGVLLLCRIRLYPRQ
jgi:hypothetical protein